MSHPAYQNMRKRSRDESRRRKYARKIPHVCMLSLCNLNELYQLTIKAIKSRNITYKFFTQYRESNETTRIERGQENR